MTDHSFTARVLFFCSADSLLCSEIVQRYSKVIIGSIPSHSSWQALVVSPACILNLHPQVSISSLRDSRNMLMILRYCNIIINVICFLIIWDITSEWMTTNRSNEKKLRFKNPPLPGCWPLAICEKMIRRSEKRKIKRNGSRKKTTLSDSAQWARTTSLAAVETEAGDVTNPHGNSVSFLLADN